MACNTQLQFSFSLPLSLSLPSFVCEIPATVGRRFFCPSRPGTERDYIIFIFPQSKLSRRRRRRCSLVRAHFPYVFVSNVLLPRTTWTWTVCVCVRRWMQVWLNGARSRRRNINLIYARVQRNSEQIAKQKHTVNYSLDFIYRPLQTQKKPTHTHTKHRTHSVRGECNYNSNGISFSHLPIHVLMNFIVKIVRIGKSWRTNANEFAHN